VALNQQAKISRARSNIEEPSPAAGIGKQARTARLLRIPGKGRSGSGVIFGETDMDRTKRIVRQFGVLRQFAIPWRNGRIAVETLGADGAVMHDASDLIGCAGGGATGDYVLNRRLGQRRIDFSACRFLQEGGAQLREIRNFRLPIRWGENPTAA